MTAFGYEAMMKKIYREGMSSTLPSCLMFYNGIMHCCKILAYTSVLAAWWLVEWW